MVLCNTATDTDHSVQQGQGETPSCTSLRFVAIVASIVALAGLVIGTWGLIDLNSGSDFDIFFNKFATALGADASLLGVVLDAISGSVLVTIGCGLCIHHKSTIVGLFTS